MKKSNHRNSTFCILHSAFSEGFSLVEICLALLIVGLGMLSILALFPAGLDQNARSISDTHAALFAQDVFSALHAETNWTGIGNSITSCPAAAKDWWYESDKLAIIFDNKIHTNIYMNSNVVDHAFRYRISVTTNRMIKAATARFWQGKFGATNNPTLFYSEFFKMNP